MTMLDGVTIFDKAKNEETFKDGEDYTYLSYCLLYTSPSPRDA